MTTLATRQQLNGPGTALAPRAPVEFTLEQMERLAKSVFESKLFPGIGSQQAALTLMMICQADGLHPIQALRQYHILDGKAVMQAPAIQARFQEIGGKVTMVKLDRNEAVARFSHPVHQPEPIERRFTMKDAQEANLAGKKNYRENPEDMLWWRLVTKTIKKICPGIVVGITTPDEVEDEEVARLEPATRAALGTMRAEPVQADIEVIGYSGTGPDLRHYKAVADDAIAAVNADLKPRIEAVLGADALPVYAVKPQEFHGWLFHAATQAGLITEAKPGKLGEAIKILDALYKRERQWVRNRIGEFFLRHSEVVDAGLEGARVSQETEHARELPLHGDAAEPAAAPAGDAEEWGEGRE
jgi:hypothetical protein